MSFDALLTHILGIIACLIISDLSIGQPRIRKITYIIPIFRPILYGNATDSLYPT